MRNVIVKDKENGNIVFSFKPILLKDRLWIYIIVELFFGVLIAYSTHKFKTFLIGFIPISIITFFVWGLPIEMYNDRIIKRNALKLLDSIIKKDIESLDSSLIELERKYSILEKTTKNEKQFVDVLLSDGRQLRYENRFLNKQGKTIVCELDINYSTIDNSIRK